MRHWLFFASITLLFLTVGCMQFDYVGQEFPVESSAPVKFYQKREEIPPGEYRIMGRGTVTAKDGTHFYDIREYLLENAHERGADAVYLDRAEKIPVGLFDREIDPSLGKQTPLDPANVDFRGAPNTRPAEVKEFGSPVKLQGEKSYREKVVVRALLLKRKADIEKRIAMQDREISEILGKPSEPSRLPPPKVVEEPEERKLTLEERMELQAAQEVQDALDAAEKTVEDAVPIAEESTEDVEPESVETPDAVQP